MQIKLPRWSLDDALEVIRSLQYKALQCGYHLALGGGVINKGHSHNDLDIVVLPLDGHPQKGSVEFTQLMARTLGANVLMPGEASIATGYVFSLNTADNRRIDFLFYARPR